MMARSDSSILGDFTGRIGNLVVYKLNGKTVIRTRPYTTKKKPTERQKQSRDDFTRVLSYIKSLKQIVNTGYQDVTRGRFAFHSALSANLKAYIAAGRPFGAEWLKLSEGTRAKAKELQLQALENNRFKITWGKAVEGYRESGSDRVIVVALNNSNNVVYRLSESQQALRSQGEAILEVQTALPGHEIYFFIFFQDLEGSLHKKNPVNVSGSQFVGKAVIKE